MRDAEHDVDPWLETPSVAADLTAVGASSGQTSEPQPQCQHHPAAPGGGAWVAPLWIRLGCSVAAQVLSKIVLTLGACRSKAACRR